MTTPEQSSDVVERIARAMCVEQSLFRPDAVAEERFENGQLVKTVLRWETFVPDAEQALRLVSAALTRPTVTEDAVERAARAMRDVAIERVRRERHDDTLTATLGWQDWADDARAALQAALSSDRGVER